MKTQSRTASDNATDRRLSEGWRMRCLCLVLAALLSAWLLATHANAQDADECPNPEGWKPTEAELQASLQTPRTA